MSGIGDTLQRLGERLRNVVQVATQVTNNKVEAQKVASQWPKQVRDLADVMHDAEKFLREHAREVEAFTPHDQEDTEALMVMTRTAANIATVLGPRGGNLKVLTHSDPDYVLSVLTEATEEARRDAVSRLSAEEKKKWARWLDV